MTDDDLDGTRAMAVSVDIAAEAMTHSIRFLRLALSADDEPSMAAALASIAGSLDRVADSIEGLANAVLERR